MKHALVLFLGLFITNVYSQDTTYFNKYQEPVKSIKEATEYVFITVVDEKENIMKETFYYASGNIKSQKFYIQKKNNKKPYGKRESWYESGKLESESDFTGGKFTRKTYWENGQIRRLQVNKKGKLLEGKVWDENGNEREYYPYKIKAEYPGGVENLAKYIKINFKYPEIAKEEGETGRVIVSFVINEKGEVENARLLKEESPELNQEALRLINGMAKWHPAKLDGIETQSKHALPITFGLRSPSDSDYNSPLELKQFQTRPIY